MMGLANIKLGSSNDEEMIVETDNDKYLEMGQLPEYVELKDALSKSSKAGSKRNSVKHPEPSEKGIYINLNQSIMNHNQM